MIADLPTPALLLDLDRVEANCARMIERAARFGVALRPHLKTAKSVDVARLATGGGGPITVSTLAEAEYFGSHGFRDMTYGVGAAPGKLDAIADLQRRHQARIHLLADNEAIIETAIAHGGDFSFFIEIDCGGGRGGVSPGDPALVPLARMIAGSANLSFAGVLTHAGHSYDVSTIEEIRAIAEDERRAVVSAAEAIRAAGIAAPIVSTGSTPTALTAATMEGVTEIRPGVYTLLDLDQASLGVCGIEDVALSVAATVIGHNPRARRLLIDAGALALSKDSGVARLWPHAGYGLVCTPNGRPAGNGMHVDGMHQEHGFIAADDYDAAIAAFPIGSQVRILPSHACLTAAPHDRYHLVRGGEEVIGEWMKATGW